MKICILSRARTRSSIFCASIQKYYQCKNLGESYFYDKKLLDHTQENFEKNIINSTENFFTNDNFVIKLWPKYLIYSKHNVVPSDLSKLYILSDLEKCFFLSQYDKIYYVTRNVVDSVCSYYLALYRQQWMFSDTKQILDAKSKRLTFNFYGSEHWLKFYLYETLLQDQMLKYLQINNLPFYSIDYEDIPKYCNETYYDTTKADIRLDSKLDYKEIFTNYFEVGEYITKFFSSTQILSSPFF